MDDVKPSHVVAEVIGAAVGGRRVVVESIIIHTHKRRGKGVLRIVFNVLAVEGAAGVNNLKEDISISLP